MGQPRRLDRNENERAQATPLMALLLAVTVGVLWMVLQLGTRATLLAQSQTAADGAALAAAAAGGAAAADLAERNGAELSQIVLGTGGVVVVTSAGGVERSAAAEVHRSHNEGLAPAMAAAIATTEAAIGMSIPVVSGFRSPAEQQWLWDHRDDNPYPVAAPGTSRHEQGLAIDVPVWFVPLLAQFGPATGVCQPLPGIDPVHFELCRKKPSR